MRGLPDWALEVGGYRTFQKKAAKAAKKWDAALMVRTDVRSYYPSIRMERLAPMLLRAGCPYGAVKLFLERVMWWQDRCGLDGLPVGAEASAVPGTFYLHGLDRVLRRRAVTYVRYTDDIIYFTPQGSQDDLLGLVDEALGESGLTRSVDKTIVHDDPEKALEVIQRGLLASLSNALSSRSYLATSATRRAFVREVLDSDTPDVTNVRWFLRTFGNRSDTFAVNSLMADWNLFNVDPRTAAEYISKVGKRPHVDEAIVAKLSANPVVETEALNLHLLRVMTSRRGGAEERGVYEAIAQDTSRPSIVRSWAWHAAAATDGFDTERLTEAAAAEPDEGVQRAMVLALKGRSAPSRMWFLRDIARSRPRQRAAVEWVRRAAA